MPSYLSFANFLLFENIFLNQCFKNNLLIRHNKNIFMNSFWCFHTSTFQLLLIAYSERSPKRSTFQLVFAIAVNEHIYACILTRIVEISQEMSIQMCRF